MIVRQSEAMKELTRCSFCGKPKGKVLDLVLTRQSSKAGICDECLEVCAKILRKSGTESIIDTPKAYHVGSETPQLLSCSFCGNSQETVHRLIASSPGQVIAYICDVCVELCFTAITGQEARPAPTNPAILGDWFKRKTGNYNTAIHHIG